MRAGGNFGANLGENPAENLCANLAASPAANLCAAGGGGESFGESSGESSAESCTKPRGESKAKKAPLFLAQSDTTAGFLCVTIAPINEAKNSPKHKPLLCEVSVLGEIKKDSRIPKILAKQIRRVKKTSFIFPNRRAFRLVSRDFAALDSTLNSRQIPHFDFLKNLGRLFSSSANPSGAGFDFDFAKSAADVVVSDGRGIFEGAPSKIFRVRKNALKKLR